MGILSKYIKTIWSNNTDPAINETNKNKVENQLEILTDQVNDNYEQGQTNKNNVSTLNSKVSNIINTSNVLVLNALGGDRIINGDFRINQRQVSGTVDLSAGEYGHDRWKAGASGCTYTFTTSGGVTTITILSGTLQQVIESVNMETDNYTLSWQGTAQGKIDGIAYTSTPVTKAIVAGNITVEFNTGTLTKVKVEQGTEATTFIQRKIYEEENACKRYYEIFGFGIIGVAQSPVLVTFFAQFKITKRTNPTIVLLTSAPNIEDVPASGSFTGTSSTIAAGSDVNGIRFANISGFTGLTTGKIYILGSTSELFAADAEL